MAKVTLNKKVTINVENITLVLTKEEAYTLKAVLGRIGGCPQTSPRQYTQDIYNALDSCGIHMPCDAISGHLECKKDSIVRFNKDVNEMVNNLKP